MTEAGANSRRRKWWKYALWAGLAGILALAGLGWYITTNSFQAMVRRRLVAELERITGGRVELGGFHTSPLRLRVEVRDLTIHGGEAAGQAPYAHVDRVIATVKIISVLGAEFGFHSVVLDHPVIHLIVYPDGTTNQPTPKLKQAAGKTPLEQLFRLSISRLEIRHGELLWNDQKLPLDTVVDDVSADMTYSILRRRYDTNLLLGKVVTKLYDYRPFAWMVEAHFSLGGNGIQVRSLKANSGLCHLEATGALTDFRQPRIEATYHATINLAEAAAITRRSEVHHGVAELQGGGAWSLQQFSTTGKLVAKDFDWHDKSLSLSGVTLSSDFMATQERLALSHIQAKVLGGSATGEAEIVSWLNSQDARSGKGRSKSPAEQKGKIALRLKDLSAGALAAAVSTPAWQLQRMNLAGIANGTIELRWKGSPRNLETEVVMDVVPPTSPPHGQLPLTARVHAIFRSASGELEVAEFSAVTPASQVRGSGRLASAGALKVSASTSNLGEWGPILAAFGERQHIPILLRGRVTFNGTATGRLPNVTLAGNVQVQDFDYLVPATARTPEQSVHWDDLAADIQLSRHTFAAHNGTLHHGEAIASFDVTTGFEQGRFTDSSPVTARVEVHNAELAEILSLAGYNYPIRGTTNLSAEVSGTWAHPAGTGHIQLSDANVYGEDVQSLTSDLRFQGGELQLNNLHVAYSDARVAGTAGANFSNRNFHFDFKGTGFELARLPRLRTNGLKVEGRMDFTAQGSGTFDAPDISANLHLSDLIFDHERAGDFTVQASAHGPNLHIVGRSEFQQEDLNFEGDVRLQDKWPSTIDLHFHHLDVDALLRRYQHGRLSGHSTAAGDLHLQGPLLQPRDLNLTADLSDLLLDVENIKLHNDGPIRFSVSGQILQLQPLHLVGQDTDLTAHGTVHLSGERAVDVRVQGRANLGLIQTFNQDFTSSGTLALDMTVAGTVSQPLVQGQFQIEKANLAYLDLPSALSDINGSLLFNQNRLQVDSLTAHTGGGLVTFGGYAVWRDRQLNFDLTLQEREVRLRYPPGISSTANSNLHFVGNTTASTLSGDITITKLSVTPGFDFGGYLARRARTSALPQTNPLLNGIRLDVHIVTTPELQMQTAVVRLSGDADLRLRGTAARPVILGRADVLEGQVYFNGTKYELERGEVAFTSPVTTTPVLDLQATTHVRDYDITLNLTGEAGTDKFKVTYRSEPPLPEADIVTLLALGRTTQETAQLEQSGQSSFTQEASSAIINQALNATVSNRMQRLFGVSRIKVDPQGLSTETNLARGPLVTIEQQVANNLTITYSTSVQQAAQQIIHVEYNLSHNVSIVAIRDQNGVVSFDVRIRRRKN
jgi:translocation and assembly module TamB